MYPILFEIPGVVLYTQTVLMALAFMTGLWLAAREAERFGLKHAVLVKVALWAFLGAILSARLFFWAFFQNGTDDISLKHLCRLEALDGGFSFHGGLLGGALCGAWAACAYKLPLLRLADAFAPGLALAMFFMRLGCLLNGCDYGMSTSVPWGVWLHGTFRHPIQLYEGVLSVLCIVPLVLTGNRSVLKPGQPFLLYLLLSSLLRFGVDFYRDEAGSAPGSLLTTQWISGSLFLASGVILFVSFCRAGSPACKQG
ncbi:hypothetical protein CSB45_01475 [candidate division KSB3 bacterium]|uniref:Phosphatidylglycerol--prolipoprotein diacylglyceryl transferase n=1 Tax=candidate division KSB3 bacterium TaxID=2044937 RepID=A0A2G6EAL6_9BACT|nr:MAG: hypothetical protein CSB45_01475 [candidate division KSB3 bacterium]PIE30734.1 MAG: hypothetical protein CSA57_01875 [candidate division KSB3 bacterium]